MKVIKISASRLSNDAHFQFHTEVKDFEEFIKTLNTIIATYTAILRARLGRGKKGKDEEEGTENTQTNGGSL